MVTVTAIWLSWAATTGRGVMHKAFPHLVHACVALLLHNPGEITVQEELEERADPSELLRV